MNTIGRITKINNELGYGFIEVSKVGDVFFSTETQFKGVNFISLKVNDVVRLAVKETERGQFAESLTLEVPKGRERIPETVL